MKKNLIDLDKKSLQEELYKYKKEYLSLRFRKSSGELDDTSKIKAVKKDIARVFTRLNEIN